MDNDPSEPMEKEPEEDTLQDRGARSSRSLLSNTSTVPQHLLDKYPIPDSCTISRTIHADNFLPLFQGRLPWGQYFDGKKLGLQLKVEAFRKFHP